MTSGRDEEFRAFVLACRVDLVRTATLLTAGDRHLAEDLVQSTLTSLYLNWPRYRRAGNPAAYLRRCLTNALIDEKRRPWRREHSVDRIGDAVTATGRSVPAVSMPEPADDRIEAMYQALRELPPRMRAVLVFRYFHDLSVADTAQALSCSEGNVKSQASRAIERLREQLSRSGSVLPHSQLSGAFDV